MTKPNTDVAAVRQPSAKPLTAEPPGSGASGMPVGHTAQPAAQLLALPWRPRRPHTPLRQKQRPGAVLRTAIARPSRCKPRYYTLTSGTFGTEPPRGGPPPSDPGGLRRGAERRLGLAVFGGIFSGLGVTGPSGYSKPILSLPTSSSLTT